MTMAAATKRGFLRQAWDLAWPYWNSEEKWAARGLLLAVIALNLITVAPQCPPQHLEQRLL